MEGLLLETCDALHFNGGIQGQARCPESAAGRIVAGKKRLIDVVKLAPSGYVSHHHRAFHQVIHSQAISLKNGPDIFHGLASLGGDTARYQVHGPRLNADLARQVQGIVNPHGL